MNKKKELLKNTIILMIGKFSSQFITFLLLPVYTAFLTAGEYGTVDLIITYISLIAPIVSIQLEMAAFRFLVDIRQEKQKQTIIISTIFRSLIYLMIGFSFLYMIVIQFVTIKFSLLILVNLLITILSNMLLQVSRGLGKTKDYSIAAMIISIMNAGMNVLFIVFLNMGIKSILYSLILANMISILYLCYRLKIVTLINLKKYDKKIFKELTSYSLPLIPNGISWWVINVSDRTIISMILGVAVNGIYAVSNKFSTLLSGVFSIFGLSWTETVSLHIEDKDRDQFLTETINQIFMFFACICLLIISFMPFIFPILIHSKYNESYYQIPILLIAMLFYVLVSLYSGIYVAKKLTKKVASTSIVSAIINIVVNLILIHFIGLYAASISTLIAYAVMDIYRHIDLKQYVQIKIKVNVIIQLILLYVVALFCYYLKNDIINIVFVIFIVLISYYLNRDMMKNMITSIIRKLRGNRYEKSN